MIPPPATITEDVEIVWRALVPVLAARGVDLEDRLAAENACALAWTMAQDVRLALRRPAIATADLAAFEEARRTVQLMARSAAWGLGLIEHRRVRVIPRNARGEDLELAEWLVGLDRDALAAAAGRMLAVADAEHAAGLHPDQHHPTERGDHP